MFYEEKLINGFLHFRNAPRGDWIPKSLKSVTDELISLRRENQSLKEALDAEAKDQAMEGCAGCL